MKGESKYQPLLEHLRGSNQSEITLTFVEIETLMGDTLPNSARTQRQWWGNRSKGALQASAWMNAGYIAYEIDLDAERVTFRKPPSKYKTQPVTDTVQWNSDCFAGAEKSTKTRR